VVVEAAMTFEARIQRTTIVLAVIAVALAAFIGLYERDTLSSGELAERRGRLLPRFVRARVDRVVIEREEGRVVLERDREDEEEVGEWNLVEPMEWPADLDAVDTLLGALEWASARRTLEGIDDADRARFGFDEPRLSASFTAADQEVPLTFGGEDALQSGLYLTLDDATTAYVVGQDLLEALDHDAEHFRDRALLSRFGTGTVTVLSIEDADGERRVEKRDGRFHLEAPTRGFASEPRVRDILRGLGGLEATRFVDEDPGDLSSYGLDSPVRTVRLTKDVGEGGHEDLVIRFGSSCGSADDGIHARVDEGPVVCVADLDALGTPVAELREPRLVTTDDSELTRMTIEQDGRTFVVERDEEDFTFSLREGDETVAVDEDALADFIRDLRSVRATGYLEIEADPVPRPWLTLSLVGSDDEVVEEVRVGPPSATGLVAVRGDEPVYLTLAAEAEEVLTMSALRFRSRRLVDDDPDQATRLTAERDGLSQTVERDGLVWRLSAPFAAEAERPTVRDAVREIASLEAVRFVAEGAEPAHGFGVARATVRFETPEDGDGHDHDHGEGEDEDERPPVRNVSLEIGAATEGGAFARLDDDPAVFVVTAAVVDAVSTDFVSRGVLASELDVLAGLTLERDGLRVVLTKEDDGWHTEDGGLADRERTRDLADRVAVIRASEVVAYGRPDASFGLGAPRVRVTVSRNASAAPPATYTILVGAEAAGEGAPRSYVRRDDLDVTFLVPTAAVEAFSTYSP